MKHLKIYEGFNYKWKNIYEENNKLYINLYKLIAEMEKTNPIDVSEMEKEYIKLVKGILIGRVITFSSDDIGGNVTDICENVSFYSGFDDSTINDSNFQINFIRIQVEDFDDEFNLDDDKIEVHLDITAKEFRERKKYNL